ncbi:MAG: hydroxymethylbilane synthase [Candidatus Omnitrophica bacterium]|nr:hydroxymethylbilane synthase [Candidatus Omnitrophota bacterium]
MHRAVVIGTRGSSLSVCQTEIVRVRLEERFPQRRFELKTIKAQADRKPDAPLVAMSGEGIFVKELEQALLDGEVDLAVHSMKDLPLAIPEGLTIAAVTEREDAHDALVSRAGQSWEQLPAGSRIGTSSIRRKSQLLCSRRDVEFVEIRGNVDTRLRKLDEGRYDAIVLAACGLIRLGLEARITAYLPMTQMLPEPGQGALGIEAREGDDDILTMLKTLDDAASRACVSAERAFLRALGGGCRVPIAAYAEAKDGALTLDGAVIAPDGSKRLRDGVSGPAASPDSLGESLAKRLLAQGAKEILSLGS